MQMESMKRVPYLDYARLFVAYLVIFGHLYPISSQSTIRAVIYSFHIPFFFIVSGMLHKNKGSIQWKKHLKTIGIPILFFNVVFVFVNALYGYIGVFDGYEDKSFIQLVQIYSIKGFNSIIYNGNPPSGPTWFLFVLLWCKIIMDVINVSKIKGFLLITILAIMGFVFKMPYLFLRNTIMVLPFFLFGSLFRYEINKYMPKFKPVYFWIAVCLIGTIMLCILNGKVSTKAISFGILPLPLNVFIFYLNAFIGSLMMLLASVVFKSRSFITNWATSLITILGAQPLFYLPYRALMPEGHLEFMIPVAAIIFFACIAIHHFIIKYIPWALGKW